MDKIREEDIKITVESAFVDRQEGHLKSHYIFSYKIKIANEGPKTVQLMSRHWVITNGDGHVSEVKGEGVVGKQPIIMPGDTYEYVSGSFLETPVGTMEGSYEMRTEDNEIFKVSIPCFTLMVPGAIN